VARFEGTRSLSWWKRGSFPPASFILSHAAASSKFDPHLLLPQLAASTPTGQLRCRRSLPGVEVPGDSAPVRGLASAAWSWGCGVDWLFHQNERCLIERHGIYEFVDNTRPLCSKCGRPLILTRIEPEEPGFDLRICYCASCAATETIIAPV
jgi:hypothetical protein